jgi:hypothetical protein
VIFALGDPTFLTVETREFIATGSLAVTMAVVAQDQLFPKQLPAIRHIPLSSHNSEHYWTCTKCGWEKLLADRESDSSIIQTG